MILIVSCLQDRHAQVVMRVLQGRKVPAFIGDVTEFSTGARLSLRNGETRWTRADGTSAQLAEARSVWCRRYFTPNFDPSLSDGCDRDFVRRQWTELLWGTVCAMGVPLVSDPHRQQAASKPLQLELARAAGMQVPDTLISNEADAVLEFVERHHGRVIHKTLAAAIDQLLFTKRWQASDREALGTLELAPAIFQQQVGGRREVRVTVVGERIFAAEFELGNAVDGRLDIDVEFVPHTLPESVRQQLLGLLDALQLRYATVDLRIDENGDYVFLELNPQGQFLYMEIKTGMPVSEAVADLLCGAASTRAGDSSAAHSCAEQVRVVVA